MKPIALASLFILLALSGCVTSPEPGIMPSNSKLDVFPNPATNNVSVYVSNDGAIGSLKIFDSEGHEVFHQTVPNGLSQYTVDLQTSPEGIYHVVVALDHEVITSKFIKVKL